MAPQPDFQQDILDAVKNFLYSVRKTFSMPAHDEGFYNDVALGAGVAGAIGGATLGLPGALGGAIVGGIQGANLNTYNDGVPVIPVSVSRSFGDKLGRIGGATPNSGYPIRDGMSRPGYRSQYGANPVYGPDEQRYMNQRPPKPPPHFLNDANLPFGAMLGLGTAGMIGGAMIGGEFGGPEGAVVGGAIGGVGGATLGAGTWAYEAIQQDREARARRDKEEEQHQANRSLIDLINSQRREFYTTAPNEPRFTGRVPSQAPPQPVEDDRRFMNRVPQMASPDERRYMGRVPSARPETDEQRFANRVPSQASPDERRYMGKVPSARPETDEQRFANRVPSQASPDERRYMGRVPSQAPASPFQRNKQANANRSQTQDERRFAGKVPSQAFPPQDERRFAGKRPQASASPKTQAEANRSQAQDERRFMDKKPKSKAIVKPPLDSYIKRYKRD